MISEEKFQNFILIIYGWKGVKEENYLCPIEIFKANCPEDYELLDLSSNEWIHKTINSHKHYVYRKCTDSADFARFVFHKYNDDEIDAKHRNWYVQNMFKLLNGEVVYTDFYTGNLESIKMK